MTSERPFLEELRDALEQWQRQGIVSAGQARRILAYYGLVPHTAEDVTGRGRLASIVAILGAILVGIGIILFVASNWQRLDRLVKVAVLLVTMVAAYAGGIRLHYPPGRYPRVGSALIFLGSVMFGASIFLAGQIYHVPEGNPMLLAAWAAGAFAVAYAAMLRPSLYLAILAAIAWYVFQLMDWHIEQMRTAGLMAIGAFIPYGLLFFGLGELQGTTERTRQLSAPFVRLGLVVALAAVWAFSFADLWRAFGSRTSTGGSEATGPGSTYLAVSFALFAVVAAATAVWGARRVGFGRASLLELAGVGVLLLSSLLVVFHPLGDAAQYALFFNTLLLASVLWAIVLGIWSRREAPINVGLGFFVLLVTARYFDFFFSFMDRSIAFIAGGLLLMGGGYLLERSRRRLLQSMRSEEA